MPRKTTKAPDTGAILDSTCATSESAVVPKPATSETATPQKRKPKPGTENVVPYKFKKGDPRAVAAGKRAVLPPLKKSGGARLSRKTWTTS